VREDPAKNKKNSPAAQYSDFSGENLPKDRVDPVVDLPGLLQFSQKNQTIDVMLIPQFSIRWLLGLTALCAGVFSIFRAAMHGSPWATGVSAAIFSAVVLMLAYAVTFAGVWFFSLLPIGRQRAAPGQSPFSPGTPAAADDANAADNDAPAAPIIVD